MTKPTDSISVRLSPDALHLDVFLAPGAALMSRDLLAARLRQRSAALGVEVPLSASELDVRLARSPRGSWLRLVSGLAPTPPIDGRVELLVPVPVSAHPPAPGRPGGDEPHAAPPTLYGARHAVRAGTALARLHYPSAGVAGRDLLGRELAPRPPRQTRLPQGQNTIAGDEGTTLYAVCDGEVRLRNLAIDVIPMHVHEGDVHPGDGPLSVKRALFITGSVRGGQIEAGGDVYVQGDVYESRIQSEGASITVAGRVEGTGRRRSVMQAGSAIHCGSVLAADLHAGDDIHVSGDIRQGVLRAGGDLHIQSVEHSLLDVQLYLGGGLAPLGQQLPPFVVVPSDRQHFRVAVTCQAWLSLHGAGPLKFAPCTIVDLSTSGARCRLEQDEPRPGTIVQLKFALAGEQDQVHVIARTSRWIAPGAVGLAFLQMTQRDQHRLKLFCVNLLMQRGHGKLASRTDRSSWAEH